MRATILQGDVMERLRELPDESVQCVVTSPPYWGLRDYGCEGQLGLERTPEQYIAKMVEVFREVRRTLMDDGTLWLNIGDSYAAARGGTGMPAETLAGGIGGHGDGDSLRGRGERATYSPKRDCTKYGMKHKDLVGIPWMLAFALRGDGWYLRQDIIWSKPNPMPESVTDRCTKAHEYLFLMSKSARYFYNADAIQEAALTKDRCREKGNGESAVDTKVRGFGSHCGTYEQSRNKRSVWTIATQSYAEAHFATYPEALVEPCILAGSREGDAILDPFCGSGTTGAVAVRYQREFIGVELNAEYAALAYKRIHGEAPLLNSVEVVA